MIKEIIDSAEAKINTLEKEDEMQAVVAKAQKRISSVKTAAQYKEAELKVVRANAKKELDNYKKLSDYRTAQKKELSAIITRAKLNISEADSEKEIKNIVAAAKAEMNKVATDKALSAKESKQVVRLIVTTSNSTASLRWNKITSVAGYRIYGSKCDAKPLKKLIATVNIELETEQTFQGYKLQILCRSLQGCKRKESNNHKIRCHACSYHRRQIWKCEECICQQCAGFCSQRKDLYLKGKSHKYHKETCKPCQPGKIQIQR